MPNFQQALLLYYFSAADGSPQTGNYVSFADLPAGRMYAQAFQGYSGDELVKAFGENLEPFKKACKKTGGHLLEVGSAAFAFQALPRVPLQVVYWLGDEDFPSSCKILFDELRFEGDYVPVKVGLHIEDGEAISTRERLRNRLGFKNVTDVKKATIWKLYIAGDKPEKVAKEIAEWLLINPHKDSYEVLEKTENLPECR